MEPNDLKNVVYLVQRKRCAHHTGSLSFRTSDSAVTIQEFCPLNCVVKKYPKADILDAYSFLEHVACSFGYSPILLQRAADSEEEMRIKLSAAFVVSFFNGLCAAAIPFCPLWGETFSGSFHDDVEISVEQTQIEPFQSNFMLISKSNYIATGGIQIIPIIDTSNVSVEAHGTIHFLKPDVEINWRFYSGMLHGIKLSGNLELSTNGEVALILTFNGKRNGIPITREIAETNNLRNNNQLVRKASGIKQRITKAFGRRSSVPSSATIGKLNGFLEFEGTRVWDFFQTPFSKLRPMWADLAPPFDSRLRKDICFRRANAKTLALGWAAALAKREENDKALRKSRQNMEEMVTIFLTP